MGGFSILHRDEERVDQGRGSGPHMQKRQIASVAVGAYTLLLTLTACGAPAPTLAVDFTVDGQHVSYTEEGSCDLLSDGTLSIGSYFGADSKLSVVISPNRTSVSTLDLEANGRRVVRAGSASGLAGLTVTHEGNNVKIAGRVRDASDRQAHSVVLAIKCSSINKPK
ncbi:hypothetical protein [Mycolicibacterium fortuitum]|uniref:hypothetical protein n=1 Tax=Mycolicibacterium fortuitum TaxID=1766 RepID=UPI003AAEF145